MQNEDEQSKGPKSPLSANPWFVAIVSGIIVAILIEIVPYFSNYLLTAVGGIWHGALNEVYRQAPVANLVLSDLTVSAVGMTFGILVVWFIAPNTKKPRITIPVAYGASIILLIYLWGRLTLAERTADAYRTFEQRMMVLTPAFSIDEKESLISEWGRLTSRDDYDKLMSRMEALAKKYDITLPKRTDE